MNTAAMGFLGLAAVFAVVDWYAVGRNLQRLVYVAKPGTVLALAGVVLTLSPVPATMRVLFFLALLLSCAGDVFLMLPSDRFVLGLGSFLLAHLAYIAGFMQGRLGVEWALLGLVLAGSTAVVMEVRLVPALRMAGRGRLVPAVAAYGVVLVSMVVAAFGSGRWTAMAGAALFFASDGMIAVSRFLRDFRGARLAIIVTYHLGQAGLVLSLAR